MATGRESETRSRVESAGLPHRTAGGSFCVVIGRESKTRSRVGSTKLPHRSVEGSFCVVIGRESKTRSSIGSTKLPHRSVGSSFCVVIGRESKTRSRVDQALSTSRIGESYKIGGNHSGRKPSMQIYIPAHAKMIVCADLYPVQANRVAGDGNPVPAHLKTINPSRRNSHYGSAHQHRRKHARPSTK